MQALSDLAADRALAQRATAAAALPRQRLAELRGLYTTHAGLILLLPTTNDARLKRVENMQEA